MLCENVHQIQSEAFWFACASVIHFTAPEWRWICCSQDWRTATQFEMGECTLQPTFPVRNMNWGHAFTSLSIFCCHGQLSPKDLKRSLKFDTRWKVARSGNKVIKSATLL